MLTDRRGRAMGVDSESHPLHCGKNSSSRRKVPASPPSAVKDEGPPRVSAGSGLSSYPGLCCPPRTFRPTNPHPYINTGVGDRAGPGDWSWVWTLGATQYQTGFVLSCSWFPAEAAGDHEGPGSGRGGHVDPGAGGAAVPDFPQTGDVCFA